MTLPWRFVSKITNSKHQIPNKFQIPNSKPVRRATQALSPRERLIFVWGFEFWLLLFETV